MRLVACTLGIAGLFPLVASAQLLPPSLAQIVQVAPTPANPVPQRNPLDLVAPRPPVKLQPSIEGPPLIEQVGPGAAIEVRLATVRITGNEALTEVDLEPAIAGLAGATVPLSRIEESRLAILRAYRDAGYPFLSVNAGLAGGPGGSKYLAFSVTEGFVAEVKLEGDPANIGPSGTQVLRFLNKLVGQRPISSAAIERALLLATDIPGLTVSGELRPLSTEQGALQLVATVSRKMVSGYVNIDNRGYRYVGPWQGLFVAGLNSLTEFGERTELSLFGAPNSAQWFLQGSVEAFVGGSGLRIRVYGGGGETRPTGPLRTTLGYYGTTQVAGISANYPVIRSRPLNLYAVGSFDMFDGEVQTGLTDRARASRDQIRTFRGGADGQLLDSWIPYLPAATNLASIRLHHGITGLGATQNGYPLSGRSGLESFDFFKLTGEVQRTQPLFAPAEGQMISLQGLFAGQWSNDILPQAEKFYLGGNRLGRGFYAGQVTGDRAWGLAAELQYDVGFDLPFPVPFGNGRLGTQFYAFRDISRAVENLQTDANGRLSSWGGGVRAVVSEAVQFDLEAVHRVTTHPNGASAAPLNETGLIFRTLVRF